MKQLVFLLLILPFQLFAQECQLKTTNDPFTQQPKLTTGLVSLKSAGSDFLVSMEAKKKDIDVLFVLKSAETKCFDLSSTLTIVFENSNSKANFRNSGTMNCQGYYQLNFRNSSVTPSVLKRLATTKVKSLTFTGNDKKVAVIELQEDQKELLMELAACIVAEAKSVQ